METERRRPYVARWIAAILLAMASIAVGIRFYLDPEDDPRLTTAFMICSVVGLQVWLWIWLKKRGGNRGRHPLRGNLTQLAFWAGITIYVVAAIGYLFFRAA